MPRGYLQPSLDKFEKALYGALSGDVASVLPVCSSWEDVVWTHVNSLFESHIEAGLASSQDGRYWQRGSVAPLNAKTILDPENPLIGPAAASGRPLRAELEEVFESLIRSDQAELSVAAKNPFRVAQAYLITGKVGNLLETFVDRLEVAAVDTQPEYVPLLAIFCFSTRCFLSLRFPTTPSDPIALVLQYARALAPLLLPSRPRPSQIE